MVRPKNFFIKNIGNLWFPKSFILVSKSFSNMNLTKVVHILNDFAPLRLAASWDNVGLLVEPSGAHTVQKIMLTNDLTLKVMEEGISKKVNLVISYHPPIFQSLKRLTQCSWKESIIVKCMENRIAVYSPHTCWDIVEGGVNDWLVSPFVGKVKSLKANNEIAKYKIELVKNNNVCSGDASCDTIDQDIMTSICNQYSNYINQSDDKHDVTLVCDKKMAIEIQSIASKFNKYKCICYELVSFPKEGCGEGRLVTLKEPITINQAIHMIKQHLGLKHVQLALSRKHADGEQIISSIAACAGSGASVLKGADADLYLTGEMSHHEILDATNSRGRSTSVILCCHSNTERGYLSKFMVGYLGDKLGDGVEVFVSECDKDPLETV